MKKIKTSKLMIYISLGIVLLTGALIRFINIAKTRNIDEGFIIDNAVQVANGQYHIHWYNWPAQSLIHIDGLMIALTSWWDHPERIFIVTHSVTAIFGIFTIWLTYIAVKKITKSAWAGILGALFLAVNAIHTLHSRFATPDVPLTTAVVGSIVAILYYRESKNSKQRLYWSIIGGAILGFSVATKYTGLLLTMPFIIIFIEQFYINKKTSGLKKSLLKNIVFYILGALVIHTILNPFALVDYQEIISSLQTEANPNRLGVDWGTQRFVFFYNVWFYICGSLAWNGTIISLLAYSGMIWSVVHCKKRQWKMLFYITIFYSVILGGLSMLGLHWSRWSLPLTGIIVITAGATSFMIWQFFNIKFTQQLWWKVIFVSVLSITIFPQALISIVQGLVEGPPSTSLRVEQYLENQALPNSKVLGDTYYVQSGTNFIFEERGIALYNQPVSYYRSHGVDYVVIKKSRLAYAKKQPENYQNIITFFAALDSQAQLVKNISAHRGDTILDNKTDWKVYRWLWKNGWSDLTKIESGDTYAIYSLR